MNIFISKKIRDFILLAQADNIVGATEKTHMTASPFGKSIATLEDQIGYTLFTRKDDDISLNKAGQELHQKLLLVYQHLSAIDNEIHNTSCRSRGIVIEIDGTHSVVIFDQLISPGDKYDSVTAQAVEFNENGIIDSLFDRKPGFIISPQHVSPRVQGLENPAISKLPPLCLEFLASRYYEEKQPQDLLCELPWLQIRFQNRANFEAMLDAYMRPCGTNPAIIYRPYSLMVRVNAVERGQFLTAIPHFAWRLVGPSTLKYFDTPDSPMYIQEFPYSLKNHRYAAIMLQHTVEDCDDSVS